ncbi:MFS transporter [Microlunatus capsulatus]|uniref:Na+/melibiose symporter-like transporter n=1 Tax=Microlunatus capsulatus TaxID=99117 RepID=A0ABS4Z909_9ACTN|nr:MFS transporter [Microlunatus capsulatus]MBP2417541.1 Na+/melibiose symporter-like transporter [Microlunatus capsulatus]
MPTTLSRRLRVGYATGGVATGSFGTVPGLLLLPYLTDTLGVAALLAGVVVFLPKALDVLLNPVTGRVSDRLAGTRGRRPFLLVGGLGLAVGFVLLFSGPVRPQPVAVAWVVVAFVLCAVAYSVFQVPFVALPAEITDDPHERTVLLTWRVAVLAVAILASGASASVLRDAVGGSAGYRVMAVVIGLLIALGALGAWAGTRGATGHPVPAPAGGLGRHLRLALGVHDFRVLLATYVLQALGIGCMLAAVDYLAREVLDRPGASTVLFVCFVGPALLVTPLWGRLADRAGKKRGYQLATVLLGLAAAGAVTAGRVPVVVVFVLAAMAGIGYAGCQLFPLAMLPDTAADDARRTGENRVGVLTGVWTAGETLGLALGPAVLAVLLAIGGYVSSRGDAVAQPPGALTAITLGFSVVPALLVAASLLTLRGHGRGPAPLTEETR